MTRALFRAALLFYAASTPCPAQTREAVPSKPLPDIVAMMREVEAHQKTTESLEQNYIFNSHAVEQNLDGHGNLRKTQTEDSEIFYVAGARIRRLLKKDGHDLTLGEQEKETHRIDQEIDKARRDQGKGKPESQRDQVTVSRFLALGSFTNARRVTLNGRDTVAVDFTGNPKAKTENRAEGAIREMEGTVWVDEQDRSLRKLEGHFLHDFKVGGGLLADVKQGTAFGAEWTKVNGEVWLPAAFSGQGDMRVLLFVTLHGSLRVSISNYRKFKATSTIIAATPTVPSP